jgi:uncharacterized protein
MEEHPNATAYRRTADAFRANDRDALADLISADVVWHVPGDNALAGEVHGRDALFEWFDRLRDVTGGTFGLREYDVLANDEHVVALSRMTAVKDGAQVGVDVISVFHYRDGVQHERWFVPEDREAWDRLFS